MEHPSPAWIRTNDDLHRLAGVLAAQRIVALDTESDSLHHYYEKTCLLQVGLEDHRSFLVDTLAVRDLSPLGPLIADPAIRKVFHAADYDIAVLGRDFGFQIENLFDTMIASRFLGWTDYGLAAVLAREFDMHVDKGPQRADWSQRPLPPALEAYAAQDVAMLIPLQRRLEDALTQANRLDWVIEECEALVHQDLNHPSSPPPADPSKAPGARDLTPRQAAVLARLFTLRERFAQRMNRPRFRVVGDATLVRMASQMPRTPADLESIRGMPRPILHHPQPWLDAIRQGIEDPPPQAPERHQPPRPRVSSAIGARLGRLRAWRNDAAARFGLESGLFLPQRLLVPVAIEGPRDLDGLAAVDGIRRWRVNAFGAELLAVMHDGAPSTRPE